MSKYDQTKLKVRIPKKYSIKKTSNKRPISPEKSTLQVGFMDDYLTIYPNIPISNYPANYNIIRCPSCKSSDVIKKGLIKHKYRNPTQRYQCKNHKKLKKFIIDPAKHFHYPLPVVDEILDLFVQGDDAEFIAGRITKNMRRMNVDISITKQTVFNIVKRSSDILSNFEAYLYHKNESKIWEIDDCYQRVPKKKYIQKKIFLNKIEKRKKVKFVYAYITNVLAVDTRYWLASGVTLDRKADASIKAIYKSYTRAKYQPSSIKSDKWQPHIKAAKCVVPNTLILAKAKSEAFSFVNYVERLNCTMRNGPLKKGKTFITVELVEASARLTRIRYNFLTKHQSLDGKTPAQAAGITIPFKDWEDLLGYTDWLNLYM